MRLLSGSTVSLQPVCKPPPDSPVRAPLRHLGSATPAAALHLQCPPPSAHPRRRPLHPEIRTDMRCTVRCFPTEAVAHTGCPGVTCTSPGVCRLSFVVCIVVV